MTLETIGWFGGILLAICGAPQALQSYQQKHSRGLSWGFLNMWFFGEVFLLLYVIPNGDWPLIFNYGMNLFFVSIIIRYKLKELKWLRTI